ncbi:MAG: M57 family metalloprotease [Proteobacteria bacterium]|nr:M57 family metalloprotease [Pseudomonadota bacterium]
MKVNYSLAVLLPSAVLASLLSGCAINDDGDEHVGNNHVSFEEFLASTYQEPESGVYIVDGDLPFENLDQLREFYDGLNIGQALAVHRSGNSDAKWSNSRKRNLTYCVSNSFGGNYNTVVYAMANAASDWEFAANVDLVHVASQDGNCTASNNNVVFDVRPVSGVSYLARAFFPNYSRANRNILIATNAIGGYGVWTLTGILRHEIGHVLGFRHEHTRPEAKTCYENSSWRALTSYDSKSVMHYPHCNGRQRGDLVITGKDEEGAIALYGAAPQHALRAVNGTHHVVAEGGGGGAAKANRPHIRSWETFHVNHLGNGEYSVRSINGHYLVAEGGGGGAANANRKAIGPWEKFRFINVGNGQIALRTINGRYVVAEGAGGGALNANRKAIGAWEKFRLIGL